MQLVKPIDIEAALSADLGEKLSGVTCCAPPAPDDLASDTVCVTNVGGGAQSPVSYEHDVSIDCWAATPAAAMELANNVAGYVAALPILTFTSGRCYATSEINATPYLNPDPYRPLLPRATFRASVGIRGANFLS